MYILTYIIDFLNMALQFLWAWLILQTASIQTNLLYIQYTYYAAAATTKTQVKKVKW